MDVYPKNGLRKILFIFVSFAFVLCYFHSAIALSPEVEVDRLLMMAAEHSGTNEAESEFKKIYSLNVKYPDEYYFLYGKHLYETDRLKEAIKKIEKYLEQADRNDQYYRDPLKLYTTIEQNINKLNKFTVNGDGTITDKKSGLMWAARAFLHRYKK